MILLVVGKVIHIHLLVRQLQLIRMDTVDGDESVEFECYAVDVNRDDYRITIEGIRAYIPDTDYDRINLYVEQFRYADEFTFEHMNDCFYLRAWWD